MKRLLLTGVILLITGQAHAQVVTFNGQVRHRSEFDGKGLTESGDSYLFHLLRTRLGATARPSNGVSAFVQIQDSRMFGDEASTLDGSADQLDVHQAFLSVDIPGLEGASVRIGRQELVLGNQRLVGSVGWSNVGRSFDGAVLKFANHNVSANLFAMQLATPERMPGSQNLFGLFTSTGINEHHSIEVFALVDNDTNDIEDGPNVGDNRLFRFTPGLHAYGTAGDFDYSLEAIYQTGKVEIVPDSPLSSISAYLVGGEAGYKTGSTRFSAGYTRLSGDDNLTDDESHTFNTLFATNHKFYGFMDYFPGLSGGNGLQDAMLSVRSGLGNGFKVRMDGHHFASATSIAGLSSTFGQEVDLVLSFDGGSSSHDSLDGLGLSAGASLFLPGDRIEPILGDDPTWWLFLSTAASF